MTYNSLLHFETVSPSLRRILTILMSDELFAPFRLVGGTNLSLRYGHRKSVDIDLFTDADYGSLDFRKFEEFLRIKFPYYECSDTTTIVCFGRMYYVGFSEDELVKVDLMYTDPFINDEEVIDGIRMASVEDIIAMKMNVVSQRGRKKDFWDIHCLLNHFSLREMFSFHEKRYPWEHEPNELLKQFVDFSLANEEFDPICLQGKDWDDIKLDLIECHDEVEL